MKRLMIVAAALVAFGVEAKVTLGTTFADGMVLQREMKVPVWGWADPGEAVTVTFAGQALKTTAGADGKWRVELAPMAAAKEGKLEEVFGTGTAAVVSPVKELKWKDDVAYICDGKIGPLTQKLYDTMTGMQWGKLPDTKGWIVPVCEG